jgi:endonuclease/exonuclease/phosphatase family metal-dependent hydrolase
MRWDAPVRVGTWNLAGRWTTAHRDLLLALDCDVLLLTEVSERLELRGYAMHMTEHLMAPRRRWAGVLARTALEPLDDPHPASALAVVDGVRYCSSILPWRGCGSRFPWFDGRHVDRTERALKELTAALPEGPVIWGGDWNHALTSREYAGSIGGRRHLVEAVRLLGLQVPTTDLAHAIHGLLSIDHIAVPAAAALTSAARVVASVEDRRLSDHDAYVVEYELRPG